MIKSLSIENYIIIEKTNVDFNNGFSVITGETGAGKSIIIEAISLLLGKRIDSDVLCDKSKKCIIEAEFDISNMNLKSIFDENDIDYDDITIVRREISPEGKSRAFVNDVPCNLNTLREITKNFIDIHSQHETIELNTLQYRINIVDSAAKTIEYAENFKHMFEEYNSQKRQLEKKKAELEKILKEVDYYRYQAEELANAKLGDDNELEDLESESATLENAEEIKSLLLETANIYESGDYSVVAQLKQMKSNLQKLEKMYRPAEDLLQRIDSAIIELSDINESISHGSSRVEVNPEQLQIVNTRIDLLYNLMTKHKVADIAELKQKYVEYKNFADSSEELESEIEILSKACEKKYSDLCALAKDLSKKRKSSFAEIEAYIKNLLSELGMPYADFRIENREQETLSQFGFDEIAFLFSANKSYPVQPIEKVASGGELSRLMLSLKSLIVGATGTDTVLFDEIDTGVSGEIAAKMGKIMRKISENIQVLSITHLPQVAAQGDIHYKVYKSNDTEKTISQIKVLSDEDRIMEIASMISGEVLSKEAVEQAKTLLNK